MRFPGAALAVMLIGCSAPAPPPAESPPDRAVPSGASPHFVDVAAQAGLTEPTVAGDPRKDHLLETVGGGVAVGDYDGDGDDDVYVTTAQTRADWLAGHRTRANALYRNDGRGHFENVAEQAGVALRQWSSGAYWVDYDNDGDSDLFVTAWGRNRLFDNDGRGAFTEVTERAGLGGDEAAWSASAAFGDLDSDGLLDLYVTNYCAYDLHDPPGGGAKMVWKDIVVARGPHGLTAQPDVLYRNRGDGSFVEMTAEAGLDFAADPHYGLGVVLADLDADGRLDIYVANDSRSNYLWRNLGGFRFEEVGSLAGVATNEDAKEQAGMGLATADYDGDGMPDLFVTNFSHDWNTLYRNAGGLYFVDETFRAGLRDSYLRLAWGAAFFDYDQDGWLDLIVANGHIYPEVDAHPRLNTGYRQPDDLYRNRGDGSFENVSDRAGPGFAVRESSRGLALSDFDGDGDLDVFVSHLDAPPSLLRNDTADLGNRIVLQLVGVRSNRDAVGAVVRLRAAGREQTRWVSPYGSFQSQSSGLVHFGIGDAPGAEEATVDWPSGGTRRLGPLEANRRYRVVEGSP